jgi:hypothetical protein
LIVRSLMNRLDQRSQLMVSGAWRRAMVLAACVLSPWVFGLCSLDQAEHSLPLAFSLASIIAMIAARARQEQPGRGSLNGWDEALAFNGIAALAHMLQRAQC